MLFFFEIGNLVRRMENDRKKGCVNTYFTQGKEGFFMIRIGINGFGRVGRQVLKAVLEQYPRLHPSRESRPDPGRRSS